MIPSLFPLYNLKENTLVDGTEVPLPKLCKTAFLTNAECAKHYASMVSKPLGYYQCPFGFTSRRFGFDSDIFVVSGVIAFPRFGTDEERKVAKEYPLNKITRKSIDACIAYFNQLEQERASVIEESSKVLPQAFHELRKLNGAVLQHAEKETNTRGGSSSLTSIQSAAELMRNNFDILEALSNIEGIKSLPNDSIINVFDLVYKMKRVYFERASQKHMKVNVNGDNRPLIHGSHKSFPIVPAVLIENAIKYGTDGTNIRVEAEGTKGIARLLVENETTERIDSERCFERGTRFSSAKEGGGFGLFLAREVVKCHNGKIRCLFSNGLVQMIVELPLNKTVPHNYT